MLQTLTGWILMGTTVLTIPLVILIVVLFTRGSAAEREKAKYSVLGGPEKDYWSVDDEDEDEPSGNGSERRDREEVISRE